ncbi:MAG TPA: hypothetical protein VLV76_02195 [Candidatus Acidoferrum sp.]|nr:hypothetical protein [Candidatus Acidoferrum sp.]
MPDADLLSDLDRPRRRLRIANRVYKADQDRTVMVLLTAASWVLAALPGQVVEEQRGNLIQTLAAARDLVVEVHTRPAIILIRDGDRALVRLPAKLSAQAMPAAGVDRRRQPG